MRELTVEDDTGKSASPAIATIERVRTNFNGRQYHVFEQSAFPAKTHQPTHGVRHSMWNLAITNDH